MLLVYALAWAEPTLAVCEAAANKGIRAGSGGWVFVAPELNTGAVPSPEVAPGLGALVDALAQAPTKVVVAILPSRPLTTAASHTIADFDVARAEASHAAFAEFFRSRGLQVVDALATSREMVGEDTFFRKRDNHISHAGAYRLTLLLRDALAPWPGLAKLPTVGFSSEPIGRAPFATEAVSVLLQRHCGSEPPPSETTARWRTKRDVELGLLDDDVAARVAWWGTSNAQALSNLPGFVEDALDTPVNTLATKGGGLLGSLYTAVRDSTWPTTAPDLVVWEVSTTEYWRTVDGAPNPQDPAVYSEIVPAVWGACATSDALAASDWAAPGTLLSWSATTQSTYLFLESERPDVTELSIQVGGVSHRFEDYSRTLANGRYFWALPPHGSGNTLVASWTSATPNRFRARVCPVPKR